MVILRGRGLKWTCLSKNKIGRPATNDVKLTVHSSTPSPLAGGTHEGKLHSHECTENYVLERITNKLQTFIKTDGDSPAFSAITSHFSLLSLSPCPGQSAL